MKPMSQSKNSHKESTILWGLCVILWTCGQHFIFFKLLVDWLYYNYSGQSALPSSPTQILTLSISISQKHPQKCTVAQSDWHVKLIIARDTKKTLQNVCHSTNQIFSIKSKKKKKKVSAICRFEISRLGVLMGVLPACWWGHMSKDGSHGWLWSQQSSTMLSRAEGMQREPLNVSLTTSPPPSTRRYSVDCSPLSPLFCFMADHETLASCGLWKPLKERKREQTYF